MAFINTQGIHKFSIGSLVTLSAVGTPYDGTLPVTGVPVQHQVTVIINNAAVSTNASASGTVVLPSNNTTPIYAHPNTSWTWTGVCEGPNDIYVSGYVGSYSSMYRLSLDTTGAIPLLNKALTAADMPRGEINLHGCIPWQIHGHWNKPRYSLGPSTHQVLYLMVILHMVQSLLSPMAMTHPGTYSTPSGQAGG